MADPNLPATEQPPDVLTRNDWTAGVDIESRNEVLAAISNAMVGLKKEFYGKGPERARSFVGDRYVFCVMEGGLTRNEQTLLDAGEESVIRDYRLKFQAAMHKPTTQSIEQITGRTVIGYHSQMLFNPAVSIEIFILDQPL
jgi:uncharacterized protein YbcI